MRALEIGVAWKEEREVEVVAAEGVLLWLREDVWNETELKLLAEGSFRGCFVVVLLLLTSLRSALEAREASLVAVRIGWQMRSGCRRKVGR